jgi:hypothetical protein
MKLLLIYLILDRTIEKLAAEGILRETETKKLCRLI